MKQIHVIKNYKTETGKPAEGFFKMNSQTFTLFTLLWWKKYVKFLYFYNVNLFTLK